MSGFVSFVASAFLFAVSFGLCLFYLPKRTRRARRAAWFWGIVAFLCAVIGIVGGYNYYAEPAKERPYVIFRATRLKPITPGDYPVIEYELENISKVELSVLLTDATCQFTADLSQTSFESLPSNEPPFTMDPTKRIYGQIRFPKQILTEDQIRALNQEPEQGRLVFYLRGEYRDISGGPAYSLNFCQMYNRHIDGNLIFCDPRIAFRKTNEGDK